MLMHADNGGFDHLDSGVVGSRQGVYDAAPDTPARRHITKGL